MSEEIIITAKTLDEAIAKAESEYGSAGEISYDILEMPKKGFLGIGSSPAKIKVTVKKAESILDGIEKEIKAEISQKKEYPRQNQPKKENTQKTQPAPKKPARTDDGAKKPQKSEQTAQPAVKQNAPKPERNGAKPMPTAAKAEVKTEKSEAKAEKPENTEKKTKRTFVDKERNETVISENEMKLALDFINTMLKNMESEAHAEAQTAPEGEVFEGVYPKIEIVGDKSGILIGHHGETLDAIQFLANLCVNRKTGNSGKEFVKITVDIENYREKREATLRSLARRMAQKAIKYKRNVVLEPMNPYERRIIHSELQEIEDVDTHSVGSDENRKVVITYEGADKVEQKRQRNRRSGSNRSQAPKEAPKASPAQRKISEEESAKIQETYNAYQEEKAGRERPRRASSIDEVLGSFEE